MVLIFSILGVFLTPLFLAINFALCLILSLKDKKCMLLFFVAIATFLYITTVEQRNVSKLKPEEIKVANFIQSELKIDGDKLQFISFYQQEKILVTYKITSKAEKELLQKLKLGMSYTANATLERPTPNRNDAQFNYQNYLKHKGIHYVAKATNIQFGESKKENFLQKVENIRHSIIDYIERTYDEKASPYVAALIVGEKSLFDDDIFSQYQKLGVVHLLAISGLHVSLFVSLSFGLFLRAGLTREASRVLLLILIPAYALLAGCNPPVIRAAGMSFLVVLFAKKLSALSAISLTFILFVLLNPYVVFEVGFQLTYSVAFAIILSRKIVNRIANMWLSGLTISIISTLASSIVMMFHFYEFSVIGILLNIFYVPLFSVIIVPLVFLCFFMSLQPLFFVIPNFILTQLLHFTEQVTQILAELPFKSIVTGRPNGIFLCLFIIILFLFFMLLEKQYFKRAFFIFVVYLSLCNWQNFPLKGEVVFIDVSQGDSILIQLPRNAGTFLIDTGGTLPFAKEEWQRKQKEFSIGTNVLAPSLKARGVKQLDKVFITHADADHMEALDELAKEMRIEQLYISAGSGQKAILGATLLELNDIPVEELVSGAHFNYGENSLTVLHPDEKGAGANDDSLVIKANLDGLTWLFTGDIEAPAEEVLRNKDIQADILKVAHHGSKTSTTDAFVKAVKPRLGLISCGLNNRFGHPHAETLRTLEKNQVAIFRTDQTGMITYIFGEGFHFTLEKKAGLD
nr:DNA internalization-related competence protein ComEC/Rec2 [Listeria sp. ILCC792]